MINLIRLTEKSLGSGKIQITKSEAKNIKFVRKSIVANRDISKGEIFSENNLTVKRPFNGISPMKWKMVIGKKAKKNFKYDEPIKI